MLVSLSNQFSLMEIPSGSATRLTGNGSHELVLPLLLTFGRWEQLLATVTV